MINIEKIYPAGYLHLLGGIMDDLQLKETMIEWYRLTRNV